MRLPDDEFVVGLDNNDVLLAVLVAVVGRGMPAVAAGAAVVVVVVIGRAIFVGALRPDLLTASLLFDAVDDISLLV